MLKLELMVFWIFVAVAAADFWREVDSCWADQSCRSPLFEAVAADYWILAVWESFSSASSFSC